MSVCDAHIHVACACMHLLQAGGLWGNLSILINAIKLNTRVDLAQKKPRLFSKVIPYPYLKTLYNNHVENQREGQSCRKHVQNMLPL